MATAAALKTLIELSQREIEEAAAKLSEASRRADEMQEKLRLLENYHLEYADRFRCGSAKGLTASGYRNYQQFLDKLAFAVAGQNELLRAARRNAEAAKSAWLAAQRKQKSFATLAVRAKRADEQAESDIEQRTTDEHASRRAASDRR